jgi:N-carbamoylputrescine amidase
LVRAFSKKARKLGIVEVLFEREDAATLDSPPVIDTDALLGVTRMVQITEHSCFHDRGYYTPGDRGALVWP